MVGNGLTLPCKARKRLSMKERHVKEKKRDGEKGREIEKGRRQKKTARRTRQWRRWWCDSQVAARYIAEMTE
ncbi:hypothetical protein CesoFtcFv8_025749 [Champsocephalus esox]|uniref:Uncharacterized protein n=1 Tax=Champsocephalus esox TaxID=159716 RepID=A0AAN8B1L2_9TELE|nr:hypothetical protein CesoFtcFv8_025749 [Champsocephalus esox]